MVGTLFEPQEVTQRRETRPPLYILPKPDYEPDVFDDVMEEPGTGRVITRYEPAQIVDDVVDYYPYQKEAIAEILNAWMFDELTRVRLVLPTGCGKCLGRDTPVLMFDGSVKAVQDVAVGDRLMGPDSTARTVLSLARGIDRLYRITPVKGDSYVVNESHILSLRMTGTDEIVNISVKDYLEKSNNFKHCAKGWRTGVEWPEKPQSLEAYFVGLWLADGTSRTTEITKPDPEVRDYLYGYAERIGCKVKTKNPDKRCVSHVLQPLIPYSRDSVQTELRKMNLLQNKHIPHSYKTGSREQRLQLLAGYLDGDGHLTMGGYDAISISEVLARDIAFVARSLGLAAYVSECQKTCYNTGATGTYYRISISGHVNELPLRIERKQAPKRRQIKDVLNTGITVEPIGEGEYFGFEIDRDRLFLLGDFTVTHNTLAFNGLAKILSNMGRTGLVLVHRNDLMTQAVKKMQFMGLNPLVEQGEQRALGAFLNGGSRYPLVVASVQSLHKDRIRLWPRDAFDFTISDEAHHVKSGTHWEKVLKWFHTARHLGVTATPGETSRIKGKIFYVDIPGWQKTIEPIKLTQAIEEGYLAPLKFKQVKTDIDLRDIGTVAGDFNSGELDRVIFSNTNKLATSIKEQIGNRKAVVFTPMVKSSEALALALTDIGVSSASVTGETVDPERIYKQQEDGELQCLVSCVKLTEGFDQPCLEAVVIARPTQSINLYRQMVGRGTRTSPSTGKTDCLVIDFAYVSTGLPLIGAAEIMREKLTDLSEEDAQHVYEIAEELSHGEEELTVEELNERARKLYEERLEAQRLKEEIAERERLKVEARRAKHKEEKFRYEVRGVDPLKLSLVGIPEIKARELNISGAPITEAQAGMIERMTKGKMNTGGMTKKYASMVINQLIQNRENGLASYGQRDLMVRRLGNASVTPEVAATMTFEEAKSYIEEHKAW